MVFEIQAMQYGNWIFAGIIVAISIIASKLFMMFLERVILHVTSNTKTTLDDAIVKAIRKSIYLGIILVGIFFATDSLNYFDAYLNIITQIFTVIWILLGAYTANNVVKALFSWYAEEMTRKTNTRLDQTMMPIIRKILNIFIYAIALTIILNIFGVEVTPLVASLGIGGLAVALALQDTLSNLFSGTFIVSDNVVKVGDFVELDPNMRGFVQEIGWRSTKIKTLRNNIIIVPNSKLANNIITNYNSPMEEMSVIFNMGVAYNSNLDQVEKVTIEVAKNILETVRGGDKNFQPYIRYNKFDDSNINFSVILGVKTFDDQWFVIHEFMKALKKRYDKEGIGISSPIRKIVKD